MAGRGVSALCFALNDAVRIQAGAHQGEVGSVISPVAVEPEVVYLVELASGVDIEIPQSLLSPAA